MSLLNILWKVLDELVLVNLMNFFPNLYVFVVRCVEPYDIAFHVGFFRCVVYYVGVAKNPLSFLGCFIIILGFSENSFTGRIVA